MHLKLKHFTPLILLLLLSANSWAESYALVKPTPTNDQRDVLNVIITLKFPNQVETVGDAVDYLLRRSGYSLATAPYSDPSQPTLLKLDLPQVHRSIGPIRLRFALQMLAGGAWVLVEDPVNRKISFDLNDKYRKGVML